MQGREQSQGELLDAGQPSAAAPSDTLRQDAPDVERAVALSLQSSRPPATVQGYVISRCIGEGAYGSVWLAREQNTGKQVAIKFYTHRRGVDWSLLNREVEKLAVLYTSRNIVGLIDVGWDSDPPYYVMEYLQNGSLAGFLADGPLPAHEAVRVAKAVLLALVHAHGSGILHCDLKPANVLLGADFEPRICDFGQSRLSDEQNPALGTLFYMAPEQADLKAVPDARWDVYALGAILYHMLCGEPPFKSAENERQIMASDSLEDRLATYRRVLRQSPRPSAHRKRPGVDRRLADIVDRCLQVDPAKRFPNAQAVLDALDMRDRLRSRRPLVALGLVGPGVLLMIMALTVGNTTRSAVSTALRQTTERALESDALSAQILAHSLQRDLDVRRQEFERLAEPDRELQQLVAAADAAGWADRTAVTNYLNARKQRVDDRRRALGMPPELSWFLDDAEGNQRWRSPYDANTDNKNYAHRDYFHGRGIEYARDAVPKDIQPIREPHISQAFRSEATGQYMVAITVPIWNAAHDKVIGVLARTTHLGDLLEDYRLDIKAKGGADIDRVVGLVETKDWTLLDHNWMSQAKDDKTLLDLPESEFRKLRLPQRIIDKLEPLKERDTKESLRARDDNYDDPVAALDVESAKTYGGKWFAAFSLIPGTDWAALVQERKEPAIQPIDEMRRGLIRTGIWALGAVISLIGLLWYFVWRAINDRSLGTWIGRRSSGRSSDTSLTVPTDR